MLAWAVQKCYTYPRAKCAREKPTMINKTTACPGCSAAIASPPSPNDCHFPGCTTAVPTAAVPTATPEPASRVYPTHVCDQWGRPCGYWSSKPESWAAAQRSAEVGRRQGMEIRVLEVTV